jgi:hypothetical protein
MSRSRTAGRLLLLTCLATGLLAGCAASSGPGRMVPSGRKVTPGKEFTRRGIERDFVSTPEFGSARGRAFEDIVPVGARITAVHLTHGSGIKGIRLSYERNGLERETPQRGSSDGTTEVFKLDRNEKIIGIDMWGKGTIDGLTIATNKQTQSFGETRPDARDQEPPWYAGLTDQDQQRYVGVGFSGRADGELRQLSLRVQIRTEG